MKPLRFTPRQLFLSFLVGGLVISGLLPTQPANAAIGFIKEVGTASTKTAGTATSITVPAGGVTAGNSLIVLFSMNDNSNAVAVTDSRGNVYTVDADANAGTNDRVRTVILSAHNVTALNAGDLITVTHTSIGARSLSVVEFTGLAPSGALDRTGTAINQSSTPSVAITQTTQLANELIIANFGLDGPLDDDFTRDAAYTALTEVGTTGGAPASNNTINPLYRIVSATGIYSANNSNSTSNGAVRRWAAAIATYRMGFPTPTPTNTATHTPS
ncbi:MAG: hypothetical protein JNL09_08050, partial [Anaerolineales bacterium]|nr:hypothetical protein [Anaerolineales bacterium]